MNFADAINKLLQSNIPLNTALKDEEREETRIYSYHLPDNLDIEKTAIVFIYKKEDGVSTLEEKNVLEIYLLFLVIVAKDPTALEEIAVLLHAFVDDYEDATLRDIIYEDESNGQDPSDRYYKSLEFKVWYQP